MALKFMDWIFVEFEVCDVSLRHFPEASFDAIFSKDVLYHVKDKDSLYKRFLTWLKPGGKLLVVDFNRCDEDLSDAFKSYLEFRKNTWYLLTLNEYEKCIQNAGFINITAEDISLLQTNTIVNECEMMKNKREEIIQKFDEKSYNRWISKLEIKHKVTESGNHLWGLFYGEKAKNNLKTDKGY
ncbi:uncharacterized protein [Antedon mediterranea]|uniref:uncharacterized protein n=1 Tax=Antedon mediterranea TaxID=105859 RepID=UPI003AF4B38F